MAAIMVAVAPDIVLATMWRDVLLENGIEAEIVGGGTSSVYPGIGTLGGGYQVLVPATEAPLALRLLDEAEAACDSLDPDADSGPDAGRESDTDADPTSDPTPNPIKEPDMDTVVVATLPDIATATSLHEILIDAGIECELVHGSESVFPTDVIDYHALVVNADDAARARALLDEAEAAAELGYADTGVDEAEAETEGADGNEQA